MEIKVIKINTMSISVQRRFTVSYNKPTNNSRRPPRGAYQYRR
ncbi:MAG: hypothetical protein ACMX3H_03985 [Sodalis sp. (in: enterobacteria)]